MCSNHGTCRKRLEAWLEAHFEVETWSNIWEEYEDPKTKALKAKRIWKKGRPLFKPGDLVLSTSFGFPEVYQVLRRVTTTSSTRNKKQRYDLRFLYGACDGGTVRFAGELCLDRKANYYLLLTPKNPKLVLEPFHCDYVHSKWEERPEWRFTAVKKQKVFHYL